MSDSWKPGNLYQGLGRGAVRGDHTICPRRNAGDGGEVEYMLITRSKDGKTRARGPFRSMAMAKKAAT